MMSTRTNIDRVFISPSVPIDYSDNYQSNIIKISQKRWFTNEKILQLYNDTHLERPIVT
jgi:hypothetical protein